MVRGDRKGWLKMESGDGKGWLKMVKNGKW
jgi:hypothetical protein